MRLYAFIIILFFLNIQSSRSQEEIKSKSKPQLYHPRWNGSVIINILPGSNFLHNQMSLGISFKSHQFMAGVTIMDKNAPSGEERYSRISYHVETNPMIHAGYKWMPKIGRNAFLNLTCLASYAEVRQRTRHKVSPTTTETYYGYVGYYQLSFSHYFENVSIYYGFGIENGPVGDGYLLIGISFNFIPIKQVYDIN